MVSSMLPRTLKQLLCTLQTISPRQFWNCPEIRFRFRENDLKIAFCFFFKSSARVKWSTWEASYGIIQASMGNETAFVYSLDYYPEAFFHYPEIRFRFRENDL